MTIASATVGGIAGSLTTYLRLRRGRVWAHRTRALSSDGAPVSGTPDSDQNATPPIGSQGLYVKIVNLSGHDVEATHVWLATTPEVDVIALDSNLPVRIRPDETHEVRLPLTGRSDGLGLEGLVRVRLSSGKIVQSHPNTTAPPFGAVAQVTA